MLTLDSVYLPTDSNTSLKSRTRNKAVLEVAFNTSFSSRGDLQVEAQPQLLPKLLKWVREVPQAAWLAGQKYPAWGGKPEGAPGLCSRATRARCRAPIISGSTPGPSLAPAVFGHVSWADGSRPLRHSGTHQGSVLLLTAPQPQFSCNAGAHSLWTTLPDLLLGVLPRGADPPWLG